MKSHPEAVMKSVWRRLPKPSKKTITGIRTRERLVALAWLRLLVAITNHQ